MVRYRINHGGIMLLSEKLYLTEKLVFGGVLVVEMKDITWQCIHHE